MARKRISKNSFQSILLSLAGTLTIGVGGCATGLESKVIPSYEISLPQSYPVEVSQLFSDIENLYGKVFVRELKEIPEMRQNFTAEKINALNTFYEVGEKIQNNEKAKLAIEDIAQAGEDAPKARLISVPLREWYRMLEDNSWGVDDSVRELEDYGRGMIAEENNVKANPYIKLPVRKFLLRSKWKDFHKEDWKRFEEQGDRAVVLNKINRDYLIQYFVSDTTYPQPDAQDKMKSPKQTKKDSGGDCEDIAGLKAYYLEFLEETGLYDNVKMVNVHDNKPGGKGHTFVSHEKNGGESVFVMDNPLHNLRKFNSIEEAGKKIAKERRFAANKIWACPLKEFYWRY